MPSYQSSQETKDKVKQFEDADKEFKIALETFERDYAAPLAKLEQLRESRNVLLDEARRLLRAELEIIPDMRLTYNTGPFKIQKKWSDFYAAEKLVAMLGDRGLYEDAVKAGVVTIKIETAKFEEVKHFLETHNIIKEFECCEDGKHAPSSVSGPKAIPAFGTESKE